MSCFNLDSDEDISLSENDCEETAETDEINTIPVTPEIYVAKDGTESIPHSSNVPGRFVTRNILLQIIGSTSFTKLEMMVPAAKKTVCVLEFSKLKSPTTVPQSPIFCERRIRWLPLPCNFKASLPSSSGRRARFLGGQKGVALQLQMHVWVSGPQRSRLDVDVLEKGRYSSRPLL
ncbi:hypothetical protein TNCV_3725441 [Trichonephila clavipes]|nr:hypothetical protein TNCV_3725441 [Trichonephila clavipes]